MSSRNALVALFALMGLAIGGSASAQNQFNDAELLNGFYRTVFGLEYASGGGAGVVKKFVQPVRLYIDHRARLDRRQSVRRLVRSVDQSVRGLDLQVVGSPQQANFTLYVVDRAQYASVIQDDIYSSSLAAVRGRCMVRVLTYHEGIHQSQAVIVSDEGDFLFERCLLEEVLQGLGPLNDDHTLTNSVFNDMSRHTNFTLHDRYILNMLYHPAVQPGMRREDVDQVIGRVLADVRTWVR